MVGSVPSAVCSAAAAILTLPLPRRPLDPEDPAGRIRGWYENELGWATVPGQPVRLLVGERFDVLDVPAEAGIAALRRPSPGSPAAARGDRIWLLVAAGSAEEVPGILQWLEWGTLPLDLTAIGAGGLIEAPLPPSGRGRAAARAGRRAGIRARTTPGQCRGPPSGCGPRGRARSRGLAADDVGAGGVGDAPDLVRLVDTLATHCHRVRLRRASAQPLAFS